MAHQRRDQSGIYRSGIDQPGREPAAPGLPRRDFIVGVCGLVGLGLGAALLADDAMAADGITRLSDGRVSVNVKKVKALQQVNQPVLLGNIKGVPTALVRTGDTTYRALDLRCTHQGVPVKQSGAKWVCPAHGSVFGIEGAVQAGPAIAALAQVKTTSSKSNLIVG
ncbi:MAG: Rieske (2Fe-2S) protein [Actinomycetales bacterium]